MLSKKLKSFGSALLLAHWVVAQQAIATVIEGPVTNPANGHAYYLLAASSWTASEAEAVGLGGHLATIDNQAEQDWVYDTFTAGGTLDRGLWIGLSDASIEGAFTWSSGTPVVFTFWHPSMPDNCNNEDYVHLLGGVPPDGRWNDLKNTMEGVCGGAFPLPYGVVELNETPPSVPALPGWAGIALAGFIFLTGIFVFGNRRRQPAI